MRAVWYGRVDAIGLLLDRGAQINTDNTYARTALMRAAYSGRIDVIEFLLDRGALDIKDPWQRFLELIDYARSALSGIGLK